MSVVAVARSATEIPPAVKRGGAFAKVIIAIIIYEDVHKHMMVRLGYKMAIFSVRVAVSRWVMEDTPVVTRGERLLK